jgi:hypothetical protein
LLQGVDTARWRYAPQNLRYSHDTFDWHGKDPQVVRAWLGDLADFIVNLFVPWTRSMTPRRALEHLVQFGEQAWCERLWIEDYTQHLAA